MTLEWSFIICKCHSHLRRGHPLCFRVDVDHRNGCVRHVVPVHTLVRGAVAAEHRLTNGEALWQVRQCYDAAVLAPHLCLVIIATCRRATSRRRRGRWRRRRRGRCRWRRRGRRGAIISVKNGFQAACGTKGFTCAIEAWIFDLRSGMAPV